MVVTSSEKIYYTLSIALLGALLFIARPSSNPVAENLRNEISNQFNLAFLQVVQPQSVLEDVENVVLAVNEFYNQSAEATIALLNPIASNKVLELAVDRAYTGLTSVFLKYHSLVKPTFASSGISSNFFFHSKSFERSENKDAFVNSPGLNKGFFYFGSENNTAQSNWTNLKDLVTGQIYCVAIFNSEINRYLGPCAESILLPNLLSPDASQHLF